jgi:hypothetical protein
MRPRRTLQFSLRINLNVEGFHDYLVAGGQGADVYKHISGVAGAVLIGSRLVAGGLSVTPQPGAQPATRGWAVAYSQLHADEAQLTDPQHHNETMAEVADDWAGILWPTNQSEHGNVISISNESGQQVRYLYIKAGKTNLFLLFDIPPGNKLTVQAPLEHWEDFVGCKGKFDDRDFPYQSKDFSLSPRSNSMTRYNVTITRDGCSVTGQE